MELSINQIIASTLSIIIILKLVAMTIFPNFIFKQLQKMYANTKTVNILYYTYIIIGIILFYFIYTSSKFTLADILAISTAIYFIIGAGMIKTIGSDLSTLDIYKNPISMYKKLWLYICIWLLLSIITLKEIFFS